MMDAVSSRVTWPRSRNDIQQEFWGRPSDDPQGLYLECAVHLGVSTERLRAHLDSYSDKPPLSSLYAAESKEVSVMHPNTFYLPMQSKAADHIFRLQIDRDKYEKQPKAGVMADIDAFQRFTGFSFTKKAFYTCFRQGLNPYLLEELRGFAKQARYLIVSLE